MAEILSFANVFYEAYSMGDIRMNETYEHLVESVGQLHDYTSSYAKSAINQLLTIRNWMIGCYIVEYEQNGEDRAKYGDHLLERLAKSLNIKGLERNQLNLCRIFYLKYPQICSTASSKLSGIGLKMLPIVSQGKKSDQRGEICSTTSHKFETPPEVLINKLSFSHIREIMTLEDPFERFFYEFECIKGTWSVRELRRQISTNLYVRAGISKNPGQLLPQLTQDNSNSALTIKEPMTLEFLGLEGKEAISESDLEQALIDHLQEFMLELGNGFCFEGRHKRILIDGEYFFPDLVFYNRILHCSVIIELKNDEFSHENLGQLNAYVGYFKENEMHPGDNPPVGILLCTKKGEKMVEYALSGMDNKLFVSTYMLQLPDKKQLEDFITKQLNDMGIK